MYTNFIFFKVFIKVLYWFKYYKHYSLSLNKFDKCVFFSKKSLQELNFFIKKYDVNKCAFIPNPVVDNTINTIIKKNQLLFVGRLDNFQKQINLLIDIWEIIYKKFSNWTLIIVGDGPDLNILTHQINLRKIPKIFLYNNQTPDIFYNESKIFCLTSLFEGWPLVIHEAQSFGTVPILFNNFICAPEMINNQSDGILIDKNNTNSYIENLENLMNDTIFLTSMSNNAKINAIKFSIENIAIKWQDLFYSLKIKY